MHPNHAHSAQPGPREQAGQTFDVIMMSWVLHRFVGPSYAASVENVRSALSMAGSMLSPSGVMVVAENLIDGFPCPPRFLSGRGLGD